VRLSAVHPFVSLAVRAKAAFNTLNEPERQSALILARAATHGAFNTLLGHGAVLLGNGFHKLIL
jgi:hypothetical protein